MTRIVSSGRPMARWDDPGAIGHDCGFIHRDMTVFANMSRSVTYNSRHE